MTQTRCMIINHVIIVLLAWPKRTKRSRLWGFKAKHHYMSLNCPELVCCLLRNSILQTSYSFTASLHRFLTPKSVMPNIVLGSSVSHKKNAKPSYWTLRVIVLTCESVANNYSYPFKNWCAFSTRFFEPMNIALRSCTSVGCSSNMRWLPSVAMPPAFSSK